MKKRKKYIRLLFELLIVANLISSCSDNNIDFDRVPDAEITNLSILLSSSQQTTEKKTIRSLSDVYDDESKIYSLAVLIFKTGTNELDGYKFMDREIIEIPGKDYKDYRELNEIREISLTAGLRDIYIIANAPDGYFRSVVDRSSFEEISEELYTQGLYEHPVAGNEIVGDTPIGGVRPSDLNTNLVMTKSLIGVHFNNRVNQHYLGYMDNGGRPDGETTGEVLDGTDSLELVRLVSRVAIQKIEFNLPAEIEFESGIPTSIYNCYVDSVFMVNVKTASAYFTDEITMPQGRFGHGSLRGYNFLKENIQTISLSPENEYAGYLSKPLNFEDYDIENNQIPLWFYVFENDESESYPTSFIIGVKYQYRNTLGGELKRKKVYYPIVVNKNGISNGTADHNYIKRNYQYGIRVKIKGLGLLVSDYANGLKQGVFTEQSSSAGLVIEESVSKNLFPWTGDIYK